MMIQNIGKVAEYLVLAELIRKDIEAYSAISFHQEHYDITVIRSDREISRLQVKATELHNNSKNNSIKNLDKNYDHLILVVFEGTDPSFFIMAKHEVVSEYTKNPGTIYISKFENGCYKVRDSIAKYKNNWEKITLPPPAHN